LVVKNTNLFAIDLIVFNKLNKILLGQRINLPAKDFWFVPGGRIYKNENLNEAFKRILNEETGMSIKNINNVKLNGLYDHNYKDNFFDDPSFNTHYIVMACEIHTNSNIVFKPDSQHETLRFFSVKELLNDIRVHTFTKNYFINQPTNKFRPI